MGLSIVVSGAIISVALVFVLFTLFGSMDSLFSLEEGSSEITNVEESISKTDLKIKMLNASSGSEVVTFDLVNDGNEKLWNFDEFDFFITYDADTGGANPTKVTEQFTYSAPKNIIRQIVKVSGTYPANVATHDVTISPALSDLNKAFAVLSFRHTGDNDHSDTFKSYEIINPTTLRIFGDGTPAGNLAVDFEGVIIEFIDNSNIVTQRSTFNIGGGQPEIEFLTTFSPPGSAVTLAESMLIHSGHSNTGSDTSIGAEEFERVRLFSSTQWGWQVADTPDTADQDNRVQIVDWNDGLVSAQRGQRTLSGGSTLDTFTPSTPIDRTRTLLFVSYLSNNGFTQNPNNHALSATINSNNQIEIQRNSGSGAIDYNWAVIEFPCNFIRVQHGVVSQGGGTGNSAQTVTATSDLSRSFAIGTMSTPFGHSGGRGSSGSGGDFDRTMWTLELESTTSVRAIRNDATGSGDVGFQVVELLPSDECACDPADDFIPNEWYISCITPDIMDLRIINTQETAKIFIKLSNPIFANGEVAVIISTDNGVVSTNSIAVT